MKFPYFLVINKDDAKKFVLNSDHMIDFSVILPAPADLSDEELTNWKIRNWGSMNPVLDTHRHQVDAVTNEGRIDTPIQIENDPIGYEFNLDGVPIGWIETLNNHALFTLCFRLSSEYETHVYRHRYLNELCVNSSKIVSRDDDGKPHFELSSSALFSVFANIDFTDFYKM